MNDTQAEPNQHNKHIETTNNNEAEYMYITNKRRKKSNTMKRTKTKQDQKETRQTTMKRKDSHGHRKQCPKQTTKIRTRKTTFGFSCWGSGDTNT